MTSTSIARTIGEFAADLRFDDLPADVVDRAKLLALDSIGVAFASSRYEFAKRAVAAATSLGAGDVPVIAHPQRLGLRDAVLVDGILVHGLDFDETHVPSVVHTSASAFPTALGLSAHRHLSGRDLLLGHVLGIEVASRLGRVAGGGFHQIGFHPTGLIGAFGSATLAARLDGQSAEGIAGAQGLVGSMATGLLEFLEDGAWTKRMHPGWAGVSGITAAAYSRQGFAAPDKVYEGRFGLYATHLLPDAERDLALATAGLGKDWTTLEVAVKPFPCCHFNHAFIDAALTLGSEHGLRPDDIKSVRCLIAEGEVKTVCEPVQNKLAPRSDYDAKFSVQFCVAAALARGQFTLAELDDDVLADREVLDLAGRVDYATDPDSGFPQHYSGEVVIETTDGRTLRHREQINRGSADRPLTKDDVVTKFRENMALVSAGEVADRVLDAVETLDQYEDAATFADIVRG